MIIAGNMNEAKSAKWFRVKKSGRGMRPASWQGWLVSIIFIVLLAGGSIFLSITRHAVWLVLFIGVITGLFAAVIYRK